MPSRIFWIISLLCLPLIAHAQTEAPGRYQVYGGYAFLSNTFNGVPESRQPLNGWDAAVAVPPWHHLRFRADFLGYGGNNLGAPQHAFFILGGGQYDVRLGRETVFAEALVGDGGLNRNWGAKQITGETASFSSVLGGGLDTPITRHIAFRVDGGYQYSYFALLGPKPTLIPYRIPGLPTNFGLITTGLVCKF
jgi:hypothetical protein